MDLFLGIRKNHEVRETEHSRAAIVRILREIANDKGLRSGKPNREYLEGLALPDRRFGQKRGHFHAFAL